MTAITFMGCTAVIGRPLTDETWFFVGLLTVVISPQLFSHVNLWPEIREPMSKPGNYIEMRAEMDLLCALSMLLQWSKSV